MNRQTDLHLCIRNSADRRGGTSLAPALALILSAVLFLALLGAVTAALAMPASALAAPALLGVAVCAMLAFGGAAWRKYLAPALLVAALLATFLLRSRVTDGACLLWNSWCAELTAATGRLRLGVAAGASADPQVLLLIAAVLFALAAAGLRRACPRLAAALCLVLAVALSLLPQQGGLGVRVALPLIAALALLLVQEADGGTVQRVLPLLLAGVLFAVLLLGVRSVASVRDGSFFVALRRQALDRLHTARYEPEPQPLPEGDLTRAEAKPSGETVRLTVSMPQPETLYLRGFVGDTYTGDAWLPISNAELAADSDLLYWLHRSGFYPQTQSSLVSALADDAAARNSVSVTNLAACSRYVYAPYSLTQADGLNWLTPNALDASALTSALRKGARQYSYSTVYKAPDRTEQWVAALSEPGTEAIEAYRAQEAGYRAFVLAHDLEVPESVRSLLAPLLDEIAAELAGTEDMTPARALKCVERFLDRCMTYRTDVPSMEASEDFAAFTLNTLRGGWDVHYATVTVLALRCLGVPARYAEGYLITEAQATEAGGQPIALRDGSAAAWAEVYQDGIGWMPLRQTVGDAQGSAESAASGTPDEDSSVGTSTEPSEETPPEDPPEEEPPEDIPEQPELPPPASANTPQTRLPERRAPLLWLLALAALLLLFAAVYLRRRRILLRRERLFAQPDTAQAVSCLFAYILLLLEPLEIRPRSGRLLELPPSLADKLDADYAGRFRSMTELNYRALFSSKPLPETAREEMAALRRETVVHLKKNCGAWKRLSLKWLRCLY